MSEKKKKKKGLGGKKPNSRRQLMKTLAHYRGKGIPLGFIQDSIISGYGTEISSPLKTAAGIVLDRGGWKKGMGYTRKIVNPRTGAVTKTPTEITRTVSSGRRGTSISYADKTRRDVAI